VEEKLGEIKQDTEKIVELLQQELSIKNTQIGFLQGQIEQLQTQEPSPRARELAAQIPADADPYALALKAMAESRFDDARHLLEEAAKDKEVELTRVYEARGRTEIYTGRYADAVGWYRKALSLRPDDPDLLNETALALMYVGQYAEAMPLFQQALTIREKGLGPEHPDVAQSLNNLAELYRTQGKYAEAEPLHRRALAIQEQALGPAHPDVARSLNNLAELYRAQGKYAEAEPLYRRALAIDEQALGSAHPNVATVLKNYADLLRKTNRDAEAAKMETRAQAIQAKHAQENPTK
jgi:tetratricopeptide (TPR) repeat protein